MFCVGLKPTAGNEMYALKTTKRKEAGGSRESTVCGNHEESGVGTGTFDIFPVYHTQTPKNNPSGKAKCSKGMR